MESMAALQSTTVASHRSLTELRLRFRIFDPECRHSQSSGVITVLARVPIWPVIGTLAYKLLGSV